MNKLTVENFWVDCLLCLVLNAKNVAPFVGQLAMAGAAPLISLRDWEEHSPLSRMLVAATTCNGAVFGGDDRESDGETQPPPPPAVVAAEATGVVSPSHVAVSVGTPKADATPRADAFPGSHSLARVSSSRGAEAHMHGSPGPPVARTSRLSFNHGDAAAGLRLPGPHGPPPGAPGPPRKTPSFLGMNVPRVLSFLLHPVAHAAARPASREARGNPLDCALLYALVNSLFAADALRTSLV